MVAIDVKELEIDGWRFPIAGGVVSIQSLNTYQRKQVTGDYQRDSHPVLSSHIITDLTGGHGVEELEEGADAARYTFGVVNPRKPRQITLPPLVTKITGPGGTCRPLGVVAGKMTFSFGTDLYQWNESTDDVDDTGDDLTAAPVGKPVLSKGGKLYIPIGASGFDTYDGTTVSNATSVDAEGFVRWGAWLLAMDTDGQMWKSTDGTSWTGYGADGTLDPGYDFKRLVHFRDRESFPMPMIVTNMGLVAFDPAGPSLYEVDDQLPPHENHGRGADVWGGELYFSASMGVFRFNGSVRAPMGLDRDQGLPADIRGHIVDLQAAQNELWALVSGAEFATTTNEDHYHDPTGEEDVYVDPSNVVSSLHIFTGFGWHCYWTSGGASGVPTWIMASALDDAYRLWWGVGDDLYTLQMPYDFANARATIESETGYFAEYGYLDTAYFDAGMTGFEKAANSLVVRTGYCSEDRPITVSYNILGTNGWTYLGTMTEAGKNASRTFTFGELDQYGNPEGVPFEAIRFRFEFARPADDHRMSPILRSVAFSYQKVLPKYVSLSFKVDLTKGYADKTPAQLVAKLDELQASTRFYSCKYRDTAIRGRIAGSGGADFAGEHEERGERTVNFVEISQNL